MSQDQAPTGTQPEVTSHVPKLDEDFVNSRQFANLLQQVLGTDEKTDPARRVALESVMTSVANMTLSMREQQGRTAKPARIITEPTYMRATLVNPESGIEEMRNPWGFTEKLTGHPTSGMDVATIEKIHALENWLTDLKRDDFKVLAKYAAMPKIGDPNSVPLLAELAGRVHDVEKEFTPATKLNPRGETERASYFGKQRYDAIPELLVRQDRVHRAFSDNKGDEKFFEGKLNGDQRMIEPLATVPIAELNRQERLLECLSWQGDRDSKPNVTAAVIEEAVQYNTAQTRKWYEASLKDLAASIDEQAKVQSESPDRAVRQSAQQATRAAADVRAISFGNASELREKLAGVKEKYEGLNYHFPQLKDKSGMSTRYSKLDALYVQVVNAGDCYPKIEMRQNATMHRNVLKHVMKQYQKNEHLPYQNLAREYVSAVENANGGQPLTDEKIKHLVTVSNRVIDTFFGQAERNKEFGATIRAKVAEYEPEVLAHYKKSAEEQAIGLKADKELKEKIDFYETLKGWELTSKYSEAIKTYVIAETGVLHDEQALIEKWSLGERRAFVAEKSRTDVLTAMIFKYLVTPVEERQAHPEMKMTQVIPLLESRETIISADTMFNRLYENPLFQEYVDKSHYGAVPKVFDKETKEYRAITVHEAKQMMGMKSSESDKTTPIRGKIAAKFAGSDSMRENGITITPLNAHNQEMVMAAGINSGYWVEVDQGVGGAVHRSNPASFNVARATSGQGAANHYFTPEAIANRVEGHHAAHMMARSGYKLDSYDVDHGTAKNKAGDDVSHAYTVDLSKYREIAAAVPGHLGNAIMLPTETKEVRERTFEPLYAGSKSHASMFDDKKFDTFIEKASGLDFTKWFNYSARPAARVGTEFSAGSLRAIGYNLSLFSMGANTTLWKGMGEFMGMNKDTGEFYKERTKDFMRQSPKIQDMMTRASFGMALADFDSAWKFQGAERIAGPAGIVKIRSKEGKEASIADLASGKKVDGFGVEAEILAQMDREYHMVGKAVLNTYRDLQSQGRAKEITGDFKPEMLLDIMPPEMRAEVKEMKKGLDKARALLVEARNDPFFEEFKKADKATAKAMENDPRYRSAENAYRAVGEILESGTHESLNRISRNFNNEFIAAAIDPKRGLEEAMKSKAEYRMAS